MEVSSWSLLLAAFIIGIAHTALGPDHTLPFIMLARARKWSLPHTLGVTLLCGIGHVGSSVVLGAIGLAVGYGVGWVQKTEGLRGDLAAWLLVAFGVAYGVWGIRHALRKRAGLVLHEHGGHVHLHSHGLRLHTHEGEAGPSPTFWVLFLVFVLGPCEPLIPLFMEPAARGAWDEAALTGVVFGVATVVTMLTLVTLATLGIRRLPLGSLERWAHAMAGGVIAASGLAVIFLGV